MFFLFLCFPHCRLGYVKSCLEMHRRAIIGLHMVKAPYKHYKQEKTSSLLYFSSIVKLMIQIRHQENIHYMSIKYFILCFTVLISSKLKILSIFSCYSFKTYSLGIGSSPTDWKKSSAFSNIFLCVQPWLKSNSFHQNGITGVQYY